MQISIIILSQDIRWICLNNLKKPEEDLKYEIESPEVQLKERLKELYCLYNLSQIGENPYLNLKSLFTRIVEILPPAWQFPELATAKISYGNQNYQSENYERTKWVLKASKRIFNKNLIVQVNYKQDTPFLDEEKDLIEEIADRLSLYIKRDHLEKELVKTNEFYLNILDGLMEGVWVSDRDDIILYNNKSMEKIAGVESQEIIGRNVYMGFPKHITKNFIPYYEKAKNTLEPVYYQSISVKNPAKYKTKQSGWLIPLSEDGIFSYMICTVDDVTEKEIIKKKFIDQESRYRAIVQSNSIGVAMVTPDGYPIETNTYLQKMFGYSYEELKNMHFKQFTHPDDVKKDLDLYKDLISGEREFYHIEKRYVHKNGNIVWGDLTATLVRDSDGEPKYVVSLVRDITEKKRSIDELAKSKQMLKKLNEELEIRVKKRTEKLKKSEEQYKKAYERVDFYKNLITHDMNNILQNIKSSIELFSLYLNDPSKSEKLMEMKDILFEQSSRATKLIENARKLSIIEENDIKLKKVNLCSVIKRVIAFIKQSYQSRNLLLKFNYEYENIIIKANELIQDLVENIIINGIKHNDSEDVEIIINLIQKEIDKKNYVQIEFIDNGIGITEDKKKRLLEKHAQLKSERGGMGLGFSLIAKILDIFGARMKIENRIEEDYTKGTKVIIQIPSIG
ncbi:MAG: PAS domain S-box protein [Candidatus Lokiarchaeota archaeon]|nr:PAS domain S-box protein [Candidatus Lokiarchaeota archaeon]MBD3199986.1 PAS domain S-box protein [Candidatus Lokiarchaeota archaeon]